MQDTLFWMLASLQCSAAHNANCEHPLGGHALQSFLCSPRTRRLQQQEMQQNYYTGISEIDTT